MSFTNTAETDFLELYLTNVAHPNIGDTTGLQGSGVAGNFYVALLTSDPTETGSTAGECTYTGYARKAVARSGAGWTVSGNNGSNAAAITFGENTQTASQTATHWAIMTALTGGDMIFYGALTAQLVISTGVIPEFAIGDLDINVD